MAPFEIETARGAARIHLTRAPDARAALLLGHGAGGGVGAPDLVSARTVALAHGVDVALIEQPYRVAGRRAPAPAAQLDEVWLMVSARLAARRLKGRPLIFGGRSMGARVACRTAGPAGAVGVVCLAFPLLPPRRATARTAPVSRQPELDGTGVPTLVIQGEHDPFGMPVPGPGCTLVAVPGDHSLRQGLAGLCTGLADWLETLPCLSAIT